MENKDLYILKKNLRKIGYLFGYLFGCLPIIVGLCLGIQAINLVQWIRYDARKIVMGMIK